MMRTPSTLPHKVFLGQDLPRARKQHCAAVGRSALVVHFSYFVTQTRLAQSVPGLLGEYERCSAAVCLHASRIAERCMLTRPNMCHCSMQQHRD